MKLVIGNRELLALAVILLTIGGLLVVAITPSKIVEATTCPTVTGCTADANSDIDRPYDSGLTDQQLQDLVNNVALDTIADCNGDFNVKVEDCTDFLAGQQSTCVAVQGCQYAQTNGPIPSCESNAFCDVEDHDRNEYCRWNWDAAQNKAVKDPASCTPTVNPGSNHANCYASAAFTWTNSCTYHAPGPH